MGRGENVNREGVGKKAGTGNGAVEEGSNKDWKEYDGKKRNSEIII